MDIAFFYFMIPASVGVGILMMTLDKTPERNTKRTFWKSSLSYLLLMIGLYLILWYANDILNATYAYEVFNVLAFVFIFFGVVVSPLTVVAVRTKYFGRFGKSILKNTASFINSKVDIEKDTSLNKQESDLDVNTSLMSDTRENLGNIFISYRRSDSADNAGRIYDRLVGRFGKEPIFKDVDSIPLGLDFKEYLDEQVGKCDVLLAIIGDQWLEANDASGKRRLDDPADFVRIEIESALERNIPVIPLLVRGAQMPSEEVLPSSLRKLVYRNGIPIRSDPDFHRDMDRLIKALEGYVV